MNWLIREKMFTYFLNIFKPVNRMHYIYIYIMWCKWFITHIILVDAEGLWHLGSLFYQDTHIHNWGDLQIYFGVIFH